MLKNLLRKPKLSNNAVHWYCQKLKTDIYVNEKHSKMPKCCLDCTDTGCSHQHPFSHRYVMWLKDCPYNNEVLYEHGQLIKFKVEKLSAKKWQTFRTVYSLPPIMVHVERSKWENDVSKNPILKRLRKKNRGLAIIYKDYLYSNFARELSIKAMLNVPGYVYELAWWKNKDMDLKCNYLKSYNMKEECYGQF